MCQYTIYRESKETDADRENQPVVKILNKVTKDYIKIPENHFNESQLLYYAQSIFLLAIQRKPALLQNIYKFSSLNELLVVGLIQTDNLHLKEKLSHGLLTLLIQNQLHDITPKPHEFFVPVLLGEALDHALGNQERSSVFFKLIINIINHIDISQVNLDIDKLLQRLVNFVKDRKPTERSQKDTDIILFGILQILRSLFMRFPQKANRYGQDEKLVSELLQCCLFEIPRRVNKKDIPGPKCKSHETRYAAFKLLIELGKGDNENLKDIINFIWPIHKTGKWRTKRMVDWSITPKDNEKSSTGYVGLKNLACICYMNSTIQQLYMIPSFRKAVLEVEDKAYATTAKEDNLLHQLKCIFVALNESEKQYFNPKGFCHAFKDWDGNPTNVFEQMDADEFLNMFLDRLENLVKGTKQQHFIKNLFGGCVSNELICKGCPHYSEREEPFTTISLQVKNKKSIFQSLNAFIEGEMLEGENAYMCSTCNKKVNTLKRTCLKKLPNHLIIVMKRFEFDYETMVKMKLNDYCEFPNKLNLEPYTQQGLRKAEKAKKAEKDGGADQGGDQQPTNEKEYPASYFEYKLHGVVIHLGTADMGHYYSLIQDRELPDVPEDKKWYEFNDTLVSRFDPKDIASEAFGGEEKWRYYSSDNMGGSIKEKIKNAYLLIYERINPIDPEEPQAQPEPEQKSKKAEESKEDSETTVQTEKKIDSGEKAIVSETQPATQEIKEEEDPLKNVPKEFLQSLLEKNQLFHINRFVFSREYMDFIGDLFQQREYTPNYNFVSISSMDPKTQSKEFYDAQLIKVGVVFLLTTVLREQGRHGIISLLPRLKKVLSEVI